MRIYENLNNNWFFSKDQFENIPIEITSNWEDISLPHTWNCFDGQDGGADYYRGKCWYIKELTITKQQKEKELYLEFNAVSAYCRVYLGKQRSSQRYLSSDGRLHFLWRNLSRCENDYRGKNTF